MFLVAAKITMNHQSKCLIVSVLWLGAIAWAIGTTPTDSGAAQPACADDCCNSSNGCCCGRAVCVPQTDLGEEERPCWNVECKKVAIPAITLPWEQGGSPLTLFNCLRTLTHPYKAKCDCSTCGGTLECCDTCQSSAGCCLCGPTRCGTVRVIRVLDEEKQKVPKCETTWEVQCVPCCRGCEPACCE